MIAAALAVLALAVAGAAWAAYVRSGGVRRGLAGGMDIIENLSATAARRRALHARPATRVYRHTPAREVGIELGRAPGRRRAMASLEDVVLVLAPPRSFKTGLLGCAVQDAPGAVLATSTKPDLYKLTRSSRIRRPIWVFNPDRVGGIDSTLRWSPVHGSRHPRHAMLVAALLVSGGNTEQMKDAKFWESNAVRVLRCLLAAADLGDCDMHDVVDWCSLTSDRPVELLKRSGAPDGWSGELRRIQDTTPENTLGSIATTLASGLTFMSDPVLAHAATPDRDEQFVVDELLRTGGTVHVIGTNRDHAPVGPLFAALAGVVLERAKELADASPGLRLDPPLTCVLDEVANSFRLPLPQMTADSGGRGIPLVVAAQGLHQLKAAWGDNGAATIWSNSAVKVVGGGDLKADYLRDLSELCGTRAGDLGDDADERRPILTPAQIAQLPRGQVLALRGGTPPVILRVAQVWDRRRPPVAAPLAGDDADLAPVLWLDDHRRSA